MMSPKVDVINRGKCIKRIYKRAFVLNKKQIQQEFKAIFVEMGKKKIKDLQPVIKIKIRTLKKSINKIYIFSFYVFFYCFFFFFK